MAAQTNGHSSELDELKALVREQGHRLGVVEDQNQIRMLQHLYGYYLDKCHYEQVVDLFEEDGTVIFHGGIFKGKKGAERLYLGRFRDRFTGGRNGPVQGFLLDHLLAQDVITVSPDRLEARMRMRTLMSAGRHRDHPVDPATAPTVPRQWWEGGIYENVYGRKSVNDPWRIRVLNYHPVWHGDFSEGWSNAPKNYVPFMSKAFPEDPTGPDELQSDNDKWLWPEMHTIPFHYDHPTQGKAGNVREADLRAPNSAEFYAGMAAPKARAI